ncbi:MAG TPA: beta-ketoacyl-ACP reductase [Holosporales bacterium]|nr:beta-ketoacyl-ACP reductase [Holosporales bacterium]
MINLANKTALITGASGGIGQSIALKMATLGARVIISGTREQVLHDLKTKIQEQTPGAEVAVLTCNLSDAESVNTLFDKAEECFGSIQILVNNAGITHDTLLMRMKDEAWDDVININLTSCFRLCRAAIKKMMRARYGRIINISSVVGATGNVGQTNYCASKAGMIGFSKALALEVATRGITVNNVAPGFIETDMTCGLPDTVKEKIVASIPQNRMGTADDIADSVVFLASDNASYITGQTLHVNGGMAMI